MKGNGGSALQEGNYMRPRLEMNGDYILYHFSPSNAKGETMVVPVTGEQERFGHLVQTEDEVRVCIPQEDL